MKYTFFVYLIAACFFTSCQSDKKLVQEQEVNRFLDSSGKKWSLAQLHQEADFWRNRLSGDTGSFVVKEELARICLQLFQETGVPKWIDSAVGFLQSASARLRHQDPELLFALSQGSITRHQFRQAAFYNEETKQLSADRYTASLLDFDISMELGDEATAKASLQKIRDKTGFDYLIRQSKWEDLRGNSSRSVALMEKAMEKVQYRPVLRQWVEANLADMYGHAGRIRESYELYRKVLAADPGNLHCLEGLAWIAFSHDRNHSLAKKIYRYILSVKFAPELEMKLAEIAMEEGDSAAVEQHQANFLRMLQEEPAGEMYNKYLIEVLNSRSQTRDSAVALAAKECRNRFTPVTADLYAWSLLARGDTAAAYTFSNAYVYKRTNEPDALLHTAIIFAAAGNKKTAIALLDQCRESAFELGPVKTKELVRIYQSLSTN